MNPFVNVAFALAYVSLARASITAVVPVVTVPFTVVAPSSTSRPLFTSVIVGDPPTSTSESNAGTVNVPGTVVAFSVSCGRTVPVENRNAVTPLVCSVPVVPLTSPADRSSVPPVTANVRPALTAIVPVLVFVKLAGVPDWVTVNGAPVTVMLPLFTCAEFARVSVSA